MRCCFKKAGDERCQPCPRSCPFTSFVLPHSLMATTGNRYHTATMCYPPGHASVNARHCCHEPCRARATTVILTGRGTKQLQLVCCQRRARSLAVRLCLCVNRRLVQSTVHGTQNSIATTVAAGIHHHNRWAIRQSAIHFLLTCSLLLCQLLQQNPSPGCALSANPAQIPDSFQPHNGATIAKYRQPVSPHWLAAVGSPWQSSAHRHQHAPSNSPNTPMNRSPTQPTLMIGKACHATLSNTPARRRDAKTHPQQHGQLRPSPHAPQVDAIWSTPLPLSYTSITPPTVFTGPLPWWWWPCCSCS